MFAKGEKIVYPLHGAGNVIDIKTINEVEYILIAIPMENLYIRIPRKNSLEMGVRKPEEKEQVEKILVRVGCGNFRASDNWNLRYKENLSKMKTGKLEEVAEVVKILMEYEKKKKLSYMESRMYCMAKQIVLSELCMVYEINTKNAEDLLAIWLKN
ncbi:CarD family transcriptional regulator [Chakrabartyella piscis]|uniref:CarD family transcriptional regulator n=1 Tax=Chakrabartyella piscis TaxID=2918914 RepID=UPI00295852F0|nr:CarD family transcriptional regulator [Chakrabartyella piscis]